MRSRVIGGEYELSSVPEKGMPTGEYYKYASGRAALYQILMSIKLNTFKVWLPDWLCESMIDAVRKTGIAYSFYHLGKNLRMDVKKFVEENKPISENDAIVLVNYLGLVDVESTIQQLRDKKVFSVIIEDDVQALFSFLDGKSHAADYRFTSLRKSIATPDGGLVWTKHPMPVVSKENTFAPVKLKGALIKGGPKEGDPDEAYLKCFEEGEELIDENYESVMSRESQSVFAGTNLEEVAQFRKRNAQYLTKELLELGIEPLLPLKNDCVPLFVPIAINDRDDLRRTLRQHAIFCPVHWPLREDMKHLGTGAFMAEHELSLVIDQRYSLEDIQCMMDVIKDWICK